MILGSSLEEMLRRDFAQWAFDSKHLLSEESLRFLVYHYNQIGVFNGHLVYENEFDSFLQRQLTELSETPSIESKRLQCLVQMGDWSDYFPNFFILSSRFDF